MWLFDCHSSPILRATWMEFNATGGAVCMKMAAVVLFGLWLAVFVAAKEIREQRRRRRITPLHQLADRTN
jgi:hypothetical protein